MDRFEKAKAAVDRLNEIDEIRLDPSKALEEIERLKSALETMTGQRNAFRDHLGIAEARLRRYEGGSYAGVLDRD